MPLMPTAPEQGGLPPELMALLAGGGPPQGAPPPEMMAGMMREPGMMGAPEGDDPEAHIKQAIEHAQLALQAEPDDQDSQTLTKAITLLYSILGDRQKEQDALMGGGNLRAMRRGA